MGVVRGPGRVQDPVLGLGPETPTRAPAVPWYWTRRQPQWVRSICNRQSLEQRHFRLPVDVNSGAIINFIGPAVGLHPDFGSGQFQGSNIGIPYVVVAGTQAAVNVNFTAYGDESDPGPMPFPPNAPIEGDPNPGGDRHVLVLDNSDCFLYEFFNSVPNSNGSWNADSAAVWDLLGNEQRPWTWTSADAAGLPIFPGLVRYDEVATGQINHAIRFTLPQSGGRWFHLPLTGQETPRVRTRHQWACESGSSSFDISGFSSNVRVILTAMRSTA